MSDWQQLWQKNGAEHLWDVPDPAIARLAVEWEASAAVRRVLDLGCGVGRHLLLLARRGFEVVGLDHSRAAIETCRQRVEGEQLQVELACAEMDSIPYPDEHFDAVIAFNSVYHGTGERVEETIQQIASTLREDGSCFATLPSRENRLYGKGEQVAPHTFLSPGVFGGLSDGGGESGVPHYFSSEADISRFFSGFSIESLRHEELRLVSSRADRETHLQVRSAYFWHVEARRA